MGSQRSFVVQYPAQFPAPFFESFPIAQLLPALSPPIKSLGPYTIDIPPASLHILPAPHLLPELPSSGDSRTYHLHRAPRKEICRDPGEGYYEQEPCRDEERCRLGNRRDDGEKFYFQAHSLQGPLCPHIPSKKLQGEVLSSLGQGSPASHSWLLLQLAPRSSRTPV